MEADGRGRRGPFLLPAPAFHAARAAIGLAVLAESAAFLLRWRDAAGSLPAARLVLAIAVAELTGALLLLPLRTSRVGAAILAASYAAAAAVHAAHGMRWLPLLFVPFAMPLFLFAAPAAPPDQRTRPLSSR
jgi:hypothetical protein